MFFSNMLIHLCTMKRYIVKESIFAVIAYKLFVQKKKSHVKNSFKRNGKQMIKMPKIGKYVRCKRYEGKMKSLFMIFTDFESILVPEIIESEIQINVTEANIKTRLLAIMVIISYVLTINLVKFLSHT